jgi:hypothetical protein
MVREASKVSCSRVFGCEMYVGIPKDHITGWMQNPKSVFFLTMQMKQRAIDCGILQTTKPLFAEMLCLKKIHCRKRKYS